MGGNAFFWKMKKSIKYCFDKFFKECNGLMTNDCFLILARKRSEIQTRVSGNAFKVHKQDPDDDD